MDIEGLAVEIPTDKVLARSSIVPEFLAGTRFSRISIQAENIPHAAADIKKFAMYMCNPSKGKPIIMI